jgi:RNase P/RNase MRP subunit POP5
MRKLRRRYVSFRLHTEDKKISEKDLTTAIWDNLLSIYGEVHSADSRLYMSDYNKDQLTGILQCDAALLREVLTAACLIGSIKGAKVCFEPRKTAGTIKSLRE